MYACFVYEVGIWFLNYLFIVPLETFFFSKMHVGYALCKREKVTHILLLLPFFLSDLLIWKYVQNQPGGVIMLDNIHQYSLLNST